jgi:NADH:ubiquinone oxidoreductase subunit F (NADH-binding)
MKRGDYHVAKEIMCMGPGLIVQEIKIPVARPRWCYFLGLKWSFMPKVTDGRPSFWR